MTQLVFTKEFEELSALSEAIEQYHDALKEQVEANNAYRNAKASFYIRLVSGADKKPSDSFINASIDSDAELQKLRRARDIANMNVEYRNAMRKLIEIAACK